MYGYSFRRLFSVARKETLHIVRDRMTLFFALIVPIMQLFMLGYAIDTNIRNVRTAIYDQAGTQESRALLQSFETSGDFRIVTRGFSDEELSQAIITARARVGIKIPSDYSRRLEAGQTAQILILIDGTESSLAAEAVNVGNAIALRESLQRVLANRPLPIESRPRVLFNPDTRSAYFFIPGLMVILTQIMATQFAANAIVREKEAGTLEQLYMTPVRPGELIVGKMLPYVGLVLGEFCLIAVVMHLVFGVPVRGPFLALLSLALPFVLTMLGVGLWVSTRVSTRDAANQVVMGTVIPTVFLSGYIFSTDSMPWVFGYLAQFIPATWLIDASRGVILRGMTWTDLWRHALVLWGMAVAMIVLTSLRYRKQVT